MAFPELWCVVRERARSMPIAPDVNDPEYWQQRAKEARLLAERMPDETAKQDDAERRGGVRQVCYQGGYVLHLRACRQSRHRLLMLQQCRLLALADSRMRFSCWLLPT